MVAPDDRRRGLGRALLRSAFAEAQRRGVARLLAAVPADNAEALGFFRAVGFADLDRGVPGFRQLVHGVPTGSTLETA